MMSAKLWKKFLLDAGKISSKSFLCLSVIGLLLVIPMRHAEAQGLPTMQQTTFRSHWVGEQVDQIPLGGGTSPFSGMGALIGRMQTQDEVQREVDASLAGVKAKSPFSIKPALGLGWEASNQGMTNQSASGTYYSAGNSPFAAPSLALLYDRDHGPWSISAGYGVGYKYYSNPNYVANGSGSLRNSFSQTALFQAILTMSRYMITSLFNASSGNGYDASSGSNNRQTALGGSVSSKYLLSNYAAFLVNGGYTFQNYSGSTVTPNNNTANLYANFAPIYYLSDKTHLSAILGAGSTSQSIQQGSYSGTTNAGTNSILAGNQSSARNYVQLVNEVKYDITGKITLDAGLGARYITSTYSGDSQYIGLKPAWLLGVAYTPTTKTSLSLSVGEQGSDIVPSLNFLLNWKPREKTSFSLAVTQSQNFANSVASQYQVSRSIIGTVSQNLFTSVVLQLSGGYATQQYSNLTSNFTTLTINQLPSNYYTANASIVWKIRDWLSLNNSVNYNGAQIVRGINGSSIPQTWYSISLNFAL